MCREEHASRWLKPVTDEQKNTAIVPTLDPSHRVEEGGASTVAGVVRRDAFHVGVAAPQQRHEPCFRGLGFVKQSFRSNL